MQLHHQKIYCRILKTVHATHRPHYSHHFKVNIKRHQNKINIGLFSLFQALSKYIVWLRVLDYKFNANLILAFVNIFVFYQEVDGVFSLLLKFRNLTDV